MVEKADPSATYERPTKRKNGASRRRRPSPRDDKNKGLSGTLRLRSGFEVVPGYKAGLKRIFSTL